ncbi:alpha/beta hydrolase [Limnochorda pilosa]|uniref:Serine aminopeptidase S33 domain-containing protein n=1 Tax=Limnochorda pilosa TaxID=1555112 RepID=A0A0K2SGT1_LIMPI|nr:alpha/beta fold hydrolase [Limnochorda pilosa]BAS26318.1 hypothetical protein LIP_0461 [Limnochorda pilosa]
MASGSPATSKSSRRAGSPRARRAWVILAALVVVLCLATYGSMVWTISGIFAKHVVAGDGLGPESFGLQAETVSLTSSDGLALQAWWVVPQAEPKGTVILLHGMDGMDATSMLGHARFLGDAGYASLALDMRAHGRSEGDRIGLAFEEPRDVSAAIDWVLAQEPVAGKPLILLGASLGGATALRAAAARPEVDAVVSEGSYASVDRMVVGFMEMMGAPRALALALDPFAKLALLTLYGVWPATASPVHDIGAIAPRPVLLIHGEKDDQISLDHLAALQAAAGPGAEVWVVPGAGHIVFEDVALGPRDGTYKARLAEFLSEVVEGNGRTDRGV